MTHERKEILLPIEYHDKQSVAKLEWLQHLVYIMGLKDRLKQLLTNSSPDETVEDDPETSAEEAQSVEFLALADEIASQVLDELTAEDVDAVSDIQPVLISEYDAGEIDAGQLIVDEDEMSNYTEVNVIQHESLDNIVEHLEGAEIIGDLPEEVTF